MRTFIALDLDPELKQRVERLQSPLRAGCERANWVVRWVQPEAMHLTLRFLGETGQALLPALAKLLAGLTSRPAPGVTFAGLDSFGPPRRPKVLFTRVTLGTDALTELAREIEQRVTELGWPPETRAFHPHLTLGRVRRAKGMLSDVIQGRPDLERAELGSCELGVVTLYQSVLRREGPRYEPLARARLVSTRSNVRSDRGT